MIKLNKKLYDRVLFSAEEAQELEMTKLATGVLSAMQTMPRSQEDDNRIEYCESDLKQEIYVSLWKVAFNVLAYHDTSKVDIQKLGILVEKLSDGVLSEIEGSLQLDRQISPLETKVPGQNK